MNVIERLADDKIIPVIAIEEAGDAVPLGSALLAGGLGVAEITFRTACAAEAIRRMAGEFPDMLVGAGTVLTIEQARKAIEAGARFIVSPGLSRGLVEYCLEQEIPVIPGVLTPSELQSAAELGLEVLKFFPAEAAGGIPYLKALAAPFRQFRFVPTGGINQDNIGAYLAMDNVLACGGSWLASRKLIAAKQFGEITSLVKQARALLAK